MNSPSFPQQHSHSTGPGAVQFVVPPPVPPPVRSVSPIVPPPCYTPSIEYICPAPGLDAPTSPFPASWIPGYTFPAPGYDPRMLPFPIPSTPMSPTGPPHALADSMAKEVDALKSQLSELQDERDALAEENSELQAKFRSSRSRMKAEARKMEEEARLLNSENMNLRAELEIQTPTQSCESNEEEGSSDPNACWGRGPTHSKSVIRNLKHDLGKELTKNRELTEQLEDAQRKITNLRADLGRELTSNRALRAELEQGPVRVSDGQIRTLQSLNQRLRQDLRSNQEIRNALEEEKKRREELEEEVLELRLHVSKLNVCDEPQEGEEAVVSVTFHDFQADP